MEVFQGDKNLARLRTRVREGKLEDEEAFRVSMNGCQTTSGRIRLAQERENERWAGCALNHIRMATIEKKGGVGVQ